MLKKLRERPSRRKTPTDDEKAAVQYTQGAEDRKLDVRVGAKLGTDLLYPPIGTIPGTNAKSSFQNELVRRRKQIRQQPRARKASWISARRS